jgi:hypothetical protein
MRAETLRFPFQNANLLYLCNDMVYILQCKIIPVERLSNFASGHGDIVAERRFVLPAVCSRLLAGSKRVRERENSVPFSACNFHNPQGRLGLRAGAVQKVK